MEQTTTTEINPCIYKQLSLTKKLLYHSLGEKTAPSTNGVWQTGALQRCVTMALCYTLYKNQHTME